MKSHLSLRWLFCLVMKIKSLIPFLLFFYSYNGYAQHAVFHIVSKNRSVRDIEIPVRIVMKLKNNEKIIGKLIKLKDDSLIIQDNYDGEYYIYSLDHIDWIKFKGPFIYESVLDCAMLYSWGLTGFGMLTSIYGGQSAPAGAIIFVLSLPTTILIPAIRQKYKRYYF